MGRRTAVLAALLLSGCDDTVNNGGVFLPTTSRVSLSVTGEESNEFVYDAEVSGNGERVAFTTSANNLHPDDGDLSTDIFVKDLASGAVHLASRGPGPAGAKAQNSSQPRLSRDGRLVVFVTGSQLVADDADAGFDVYLRDLDTSDTVLVSRATGAAGANSTGNCQDPDISPDGRFVVFASSATNIAAGDVDTTYDIFIRDLQLNTTELVSRPTGAAGKSNGQCTVPRVSEGGTRVAFLSSATNLGVAAAVQQAYVRDRVTLATVLVTQTTGTSNVPAVLYSNDLDISDNGRFVVFSTQAPLDPADTDVSVADAYVRDVDGAVTELVSRKAGAAGIDIVDEVLYPAMSGDGRFVSFSTTSSSLVAGDENAKADVFLRDRALQTVVRISLRTFGGEAHDDSLKSSLSTDGKVGAFVSKAINLVAGDGNSVQDAFVRRPLW